MQSFDVSCESAMLELGNCWASRLGGVVFIDGDLGAGKTTLARGILRGLGYCGAVASPTYTLVEHYSLPAGDVYHIDLYRLTNPAELEMIGLRDVLDSAATLLVEWSIRGAGHVPKPDFCIQIDCPNDDPNKGRRVQVHVANGAPPLPCPTP